eukprot:TRINITY_DN18923_c0_g1_i2.p1 TRINITY_DN18923_c0_g1~~TRINITY_DN18923_c0_g1_i2.p1  ORF type:complete len:1548 (-),score=129.83 TRINITY_DN18923_c0_g1_i2:387-4514(-)
MVKPAFFHTQKNCSRTGLLAHDKTTNLCSSCTDGHPRCGCMRPEKGAVCLVGDQIRYDPFANPCQSECDLYQGACKGVHILNKTDTCYSCLLFADCIAPQDGEDVITVDMGPPAFGDWIVRKGACPGGCESYRIPGIEVPVLSDAPAAYYKPWFADQESCLKDSRCKFCTYQFPTIPGLDDPGCFSKEDEPYRSPLLLLDQSAKAYCAWDEALDRTPAAACALYTTYGACAGSVSLGCQWCLSAEPTSRFAQREKANDPTLSRRLRPKCVYYLDALNQGCLSVRSLHRLPTASQIPLQPLFTDERLYDSRELACGAHQIIPNILTMVSENSSTTDRWYSAFGDFDVSSKYDVAYVPMYVPPDKRDAQLSRLGHCKGYTTVRGASQECKQAIADTCSSCLRTAGCWWSDMGLQTQVSGEFVVDYGASSFMPGCYHSKAQQAYVKTVSSLSKDAGSPLRALTVPEDAQFCFDPCWQYEDCGSCIGEGARHHCQWCDYSDDDRAYCRSSIGPYQQCIDKYTLVEECPIQHLHPPQSIASPKSASEQWLWIPCCLAAIALLVLLPMVIIICSITRRNLHQRSSAPSTELPLMQHGDSALGCSRTLNVLQSSEESDHGQLETRVELRFSDLGFRAKIGQVEKQVLRGVSGTLSSGEFLAVMGPSGSGKTTFLDVLAKRKLRGDACDGEVVVNGTTVTPDVRSYCGGLTEFVTQQDTLLPVHTVTEMLRFVADLKLPATMPSEAKDERVRETIKMVDLQHRANAYIGNNLVRGLSGGERRRASIAQALVPRAPVLFLDEPTSGLSSTDSLRVIEMLSELAKSHGYAVVAVVHQPPSRLFNHFDKLLLLSGGEVCYMGSASRAVEWFEKVTVSTIPSAMNPADWLLDIITPGFMETDVIASCQRQAAQERSGQVSGEVQELSFHCNSKFGHRPCTDLSSIAEYRTGRWHQFRIILHRCFQSKLRSWQVLLIRFGVNLGVAILAGAALPLAYPLFVDGFTSEPSRQINAVLFFVVTFEGLVALTVLPLFSEGRELFATERKSKLYRLAPYFIANFLAETVVQSYSSLLFGAAFYTIVNLSHDVNRLAFYLLATVLIGECASAFAQFCSSASRSIVNSLALCAMGLGCFLLFSGFLVLPSSMTSIFLPVYHVSFWKYGFQALAINEYAAAQFPCQSLSYNASIHCPPFAFSKDCPPYPCANKHSGDVAAIHETYRFSAYAEVHNYFVNSEFALRFLGLLDARRVNCAFLCGLEDAPGRYDNDECVCSTLGNCRNFTTLCDPFLWKENRGFCTDDRRLNGVPANSSCAPSVENIAGEYFLDLLGFGRVDAKGHPVPENDRDMESAMNRYVTSSPVVTKYAWLLGLLAIMAAFRVANFILLVCIRD